MSLIDCRYCDETHGDLLMCGPARRLLDALHTAGQMRDLPTVEFERPVMDPAMLGDGTVLLGQVVVKAAVVPVGGVIMPVLVFTGVAADGNPLPNWLYAGIPAEIRRVEKLVADMAGLAIRTARKQAGGPA